MKRVKKPKNRNRFDDGLLVVGLGNPGSEYHDTRHNAGFLVVEEIARRYSSSFITQRPGHYVWTRVKIGSYVFFLTMPFTYMNRSGDVIHAVLSKSGASPDDLLVVCDSLDLPTGSIRLKQKGGSGGQKGLESIIGSLGTDQFRRLFIGIGRPEFKTDVKRYVLDEPSGEEKTLFMEGIDRAADAVISMAHRDFTLVMNEFNRKEKPA